MIIWDSFITGLKRVWKNKSLVLILFLFKLFFALLLLIPAFYMFSTTFSFSPNSLNILKGYDFAFLFDFLHQWGGTLELYRVLFLVTVFVSVIGYIFLSGGLWGALFRDLKEGTQKFRGERFFGDCARYFWSFFKIFIFVSLLYILSALLGFLIFILIKTLAGRELSSIGNIIILFSGIVIFVILFTLVDMISDYVRIHRIFFEEKKVKRILKPSLKFVFRNFSRVVLLYYLLTLILLGTLILYLGTNKLLNIIFMEKVLILSMLILQQVYSLFRSFYRLVYYSSQLVLFDKLWSVRL